jgi:hypothetical protein
VKACGRQVYRSIDIAKALAKQTHRKVSHCAACAGWHLDTTESRRILSAHTRRVLERELA